MKKGISLGQYMIVLFTVFGVLLICAIFPIVNTNVTRMEEHLISDRLVADIHYIEDLIGDGDWNLKDGNICRGDVVVGDGTQERANLEPFLKHENRTGTFSYVFIRCGDEGLTYVEDTPTQAGYQQGHFLRVAGSTLDPNGNSIVGTYMDKKVADILDENDTYDGEANVAGGMIYCRYDTLKDRDGNVIGAIVVGRSIEELKQQIGDTTRLVAIGGMAAIALGSVLLFFFINRWVHALRRATDFVQRIEKGDIPQERLRATNLREVDILSQGVNSLVDTLHENEELRVKSETDELTGLANRLGMNNYGYELFDRCKEAGQPISAGMLDIDYFKAFNDNYGHQEGDKCIVKVARVLKRFQDEGRLFAVRYGGDEFIIITHGLDQDGVARIAEEIHEAVIDAAIPHAYSPVSSTVSVSQGHFVAVPKGGATLLDHLTAADTVMYKVKSGARNGFRVEQDQDASDVEDESNTVLRERTERAIEWSTYHDYLTQVLNREGFYREVARTLEENPGKDYRIVRSNIRNFKLVNQLFGYDRGNAILIETAEMLRSGKIANTAAGRIHGDHFAFLVAHDEYDEGNIRACFSEQAQKIADSDYALQYALGVYDIANRSMDVSVMCDCANVALASGGHDSDTSISHYEPQMMEGIIKENFIVAEFDRALESGQFQVFLQPIVDATGQPVNAEALIRWYRPDEGTYLAPGAFIEVLEKANLIYKLDLSVWERAAQLVAEWKGTPMEGLALSLNISPLDIVYVDIVQTFVDLANRYDIEPSKLNLEFTETVLVSNVEQYSSLITSLHDKGFHVEIDDFGTGYSSLNMLRKIHADVLKIDKDFLEEFEGSERSRDILASVVEMAKKLQMTVIAEGVETQEQVDYLKQIGCDLLQGFYFSKPVEVEEFLNRYYPDRKS